MMRYDPLNTLRQLQTDLDRIFSAGSQGMLGTPSENGESASNWMPAVDIAEDDKAYHVHVDLPGVDAENIDVAMDNGMLTIKGYREDNKSEDGPNWKRVERVRGTFFRRFTLPENVDADNIQARCRNGVLEVAVPKREEQPGKRIKVEQAS
ncbi:Hsp20/alpha crystallin family protein [Halorhodospira halochloris]